MAIELPKDIQDHLITSIKRFFAENMDEEIGDLRALFFLEFCLKEIGPSIYNQAVADAQRYIQERVADIGSACYQPPLGYWQD